jgi:tetratricopeptide (TPR) repeat protein
MTRLVPMMALLGSRAALILVPALLLVYPSITPAQTADAFGDSAADPVKLFERGQSAHARNDLAKALEFYEEAIKVRPEFPEAEFQRGLVLVSLDRLAEAESGFRRALELRRDWPLPYSALGALLARVNREREADPLLRQALKLDGRNNVALRVLADLRLRAGDAREALELARRATGDQEAPLSAWILRAMAERAATDRVGAAASLDHVLQIEPGNLAALIERAELRVDNGDYEHAIEDLKAAERIKKGDPNILSRLVAAYERAGKPEEAQRIAEAAGLVKPEEPASDGAIKVVGTPEEIAEANNEDRARARKALGKLLEKNPRNAMLQARLGASYRTDDPTRSLDLYRRAAEIEPNNPDYATGYASALVQARRFSDAVTILRRAIAVAPNNYAAHANLATALYKLKQYSAALAEYEWLLKAKPDLAVAYYFIATAHDYLGEYEQALVSYETFLAHAAVQTNQLEIDKVKLRLPSLRRQIQLKQGVKHKQ